MDGGGAARAPALAAMAAASVWRIIVVRCILAGWLVAVRPPALVVPLARAGSLVFAVLLSRPPATAEQQQLLLSRGRRCVCCWFYRLFVQQGQLRHLKKIHDQVF
jgi:hypothetical protein